MDPNYITFFKSGRFFAVLSWWYLVNLSFCSFCGICFGTFGMRAFNVSGNSDRSFLDWRHSAGDFKLFSLGMFLRLSKAIAKPVPSS